MFDEKLNEFGWPFISLFLINQQRFGAFEK
jgi:hypothetical protein